jgi:hypothetical protein
MSRALEGYVGIEHRHIPDSSLPCASQPCSHFNRSEICAPNLFIPGRRHIVWAGQGADH